MSDSDVELDIPAFRICDGVWTLTNLDDILTQVVDRTVKQMSGLEVAVTDPVPLRPHSTLWSWVKVVEPKSAMVVIAMEPELANVLAARCIGDQPAVAVARGVVPDTQAELTSVVAARLAVAMITGAGPVHLGIPRTGVDMPDVGDGSWVAKHLRTEAGAMAVFVKGEVLTAPPVPPHGAHDEATVVMSLDGNEVAPPDQHFVPVQSRAIPPITANMPVSIGGYRIIDQLGFGGMGVVYKAHHDHLDRLVALKVMLPVLASNQEFIDRFLREGKSSAKVDHPNVVPIYDAGFQDGRLFLAMRFVPGGDLATLLHRSGAIPEDHALSIIRRCLSGLQAIDDLGMIHRDIKPANILLETNGVPRLADLGLARTLADGNVSLPGATQGTPAFMSPEQARASKNIDIRCDIYALGVTLFCMLCGQPPFPGDSPYDVVAKVLYQPTPDLRTFNDRISLETVTVVNKAMAKDPAQRYQTPGEFRHAVEDILNYHGGSIASSSNIRLPGRDNYWIRKVFGTLPPLYSEAPVRTAP